MDTAPGEFGSLLASWTIYPSVYPALAGRWLAQAHNGKHNAASDTYTGIHCAA
jgi:hypothetical protein